MPKESIASVKLVHIVRISCHWSAAHTPVLPMSFPGMCWAWARDTRLRRWGVAWLVAVSVCHTRIYQVILGKSEQLTSWTVTSKMDGVLNCMFWSPILGTGAMSLPLRFAMIIFLFSSPVHSLSPVIEVSKRGSACSVLDANEHSCKNSWRWLLPMNPALWKKTVILPREGCMYHNVPEKSSCLVLEVISNLRWRVLRYWFLWYCNIYSSLFYKYATLDIM